MRNRVLTWLLKHVARPIVRAWSRQLDARSYTFRFDEPDVVERAENVIHDEWMRS